MRMVLIMHGRRPVRRQVMARDEDYVVHLDIEATLDHKRMPSAEVLEEEALVPAGERGVMS